MIGFKNTDKWVEASDRLDEMSNEKLKAYRAKARADSIAKINTDRKKSISRSIGAQKAELKIMSRQSIKSAHANDNDNHTKLKKVNEDKEISHYAVHKRSDHSKVGQAKTLNAARRAVDRRDNAHGSYEHYVKTVFKEDGMAVPTNNAGSGQVAGVGVGANGEPGVSKKKTPKLLKNVLQRKLP